MNDYKKTLATLQMIKNAVEDAEEQHSYAMNSAFKSKQEKDDQAVMTMNTVYKALKNDLERRLQ